MKKLLFIVLAVTMALNANAQYKTFVFGDKKYESYCQRLSNDTICLSITLDSTDPYMPNPQMLMMAKQQRANFVNNLKTLKNKFVEYDSICKKNNVENISRTINHKDDINEYPIILFDKEGKHYSTTPLYFAYVRKEGKSVMCVHSGSLVDMRDENIKFDGGLILFFSIDEISEMIKSFKEDEITKYLNLLN